MNHKIWVARLPAFFANELIRAEPNDTCKQMSHGGCRIVSFLSYTNTSALDLQGFGAAQRADILGCIQLGKEGNW